MGGSDGVAVGVAAVGCAGWEAMRAAVLKVLSVAASKPSR